MKQYDNEIWSEYTAFMSTEQRYEITPDEIKRNLEQERAKRRETTLGQGKFFVDCPLKEWEQKLSLIAVSNCKSRSEWQNEEALDIRLMATGVMVHKSAEELLQRYRDKIQRIYKTESMYEKQIKTCEVMIDNLKSQIVALEHTERKRALRSAKNKLKHWQERLTGLKINMAHHLSKENRLEYKNMKWLGITEKIKTAAISHEIQEEKRGTGNKYGFNPKAQSRETAEIMFTD